eukprot:649236-Pleurochrysis_carterae.AAC.2
MVRSSRARIVWVEGRRARAGEKRRQNALGVLSDCACCWRFRKLGFGVWLIGGAAAKRLGTSKQISSTRKGGRRGWGRSIARGVGRAPEIEAKTTACGSSGDTSTATAASGAKTKRGIEALCEVHRKCRGLETGSVASVFGVLGRQKASERKRATDRPGDGQFSEAERALQDTSVAERRGAEGETGRRGRDGAHHLWRRDGCGSQGWCAGHHASSEEAARASGDSLHSGKSCVGE